MRFSPSPHGPSYLLLVPVLAGTMAMTVAGPLPAQDATPPQVERIVMEPDSLVLTVGQRVPITVTAYDASGNPVADPDMMVWTQGAEASVDQGAGLVTGIRPGETVIETRIRRWGTAGMKHARKTIVDTPAVK